MMSMEPDHYGILELPPGSPMEDIKSQYRRLAKRYHPDLHGDDAAFQEQFRRVNAAYTFLSDAPRKAAYDAVLQAARKSGAPPLKAVPPPRTASSPTATGHHTPATAPGFHPRSHEQPSNDVRMTRSAWLGATAGAVLVLLVIGLSLDGSGPGRLAPAEVASPAPPGSASGSALRGDSGLGTGSAPGADAAPPTDSPTAPLAGPGAAPAPHPHDYPGVANNPWMPPRAIMPPSAGADATGALRRLLLARYHAVLPRTDRLLGRGYAVRGAGQETENGSRRILRAQLAADLADLSAARARLRPAFARLSRQEAPGEMQQEAGPILTDLNRLEDARQPVRDDIRALAAIPASDHVPPAVFRFSPPPPTRAASVIPARVIPAHIVPNYPLPAVASIHLEAPKPPDKPAPPPAVKPKPPASSGQEFIMWGK